MDNSLLGLFMLLIAVMLASLPTGYFMLVGSTMNPFSANMGLVALLLVAMFLMTLGFGTALQSSNCGGVKDVKRVAQNAGIATGILTGFLIIPIAHIPWLHNMASSLYNKGGTDAERIPIDIGFWALWGALYGFAVGGTLSTSC
jgi:hypothetical protein